MPRNVVTVVPRSFPPLARHRRERKRILDAVSERHRPTPNARGGHRGVTLDFSKREERSEARAKVVGWLGEINPDWRRYVKVYPRA